MDLLSFLAKQRNGQNEKKTEGPSAKVEKDLQEKISQYEGKSREELMEELLTSVDAAKKDGTFTKEALEEFKSKVAPMLNEEQRERLDEIAKKLE